MSGTQKWVATHLLSTKADIHNIWPTSQMWTVKLLMRPTMLFFVNETPFESRKRPFYVSEIFNWPARRFKLCTRALYQACTTYGPRTKYGPRKLLIWPAKVKIFFSACFLWNHLLLIFCPWILKYLFIWPNMKIELFILVLKYFWNNLFVTSPSKRDTVITILRKDVRIGKAEREIK